MTTLQIQKIDSLLKELPEEKLQMAVNFILWLKQSDDVLLQFMRNTPNTNNIDENKTISLKRGSAKNTITFIADDFNEPNFL